MKADARVVVIFAVQHGELFRRLRLFPLQRLECRLIAYYPLRGMLLRVNRFEYLGGLAPSFDDERADRSTMMPFEFFDDIARYANTRANRLVEAFETRGRV